MNDCLWRIELLGGLTARRGSLAITRFRSRKTGGLLAYLALHIDRSHPRDELIELFWPESPLSRSRSSLRTALASLRRQLEPPGEDYGSVLAADSACVRLNPLAATTDVVEFLAALDAASRCETGPDRVRHLQAAVGSYRGDLLPGFYDDWIVPERRRLQEARIDMLAKLSRLLAASGDLGRATRAAEMALEADPLREESHRNLLRLYATAGRHSVAVAPFPRSEAVIHPQAGVVATESGREIAKRARSAARTPSPACVTPTAPPDPGQRNAAPESALRPAPPLPLALSRFFGRTAELKALVHFLAPDPTDGARRLCTITGPGGVGKTRTAVETARALRGEYGARVWYVSVAEADTVDQLASAIAGCLSIQRRGSAPFVDQVAEALGKQPSLLVIDNFEQIADRGPSLVAAILARTPGLKILVTSRRRLDLAGEREVPLGPLGLPGDECDRDSLLRTPSVQLFVDRSQAVLPDFQLTAGNARAVADVCRILEGIPLSIELGAARAQTLTPARMAERLSERFEVLTAVRRDRVARHQSLRAAIDWSYRLLSPSLQQFFRRLSVFRGGFSAEAAEVVCGEPSAADLLAQLRSHSLVQVLPDDADIRYAMLESIREYAAEQLGDEVPGVRYEHSQFYSGVALSAGGHLTAENQAVWIARLESELANIYEALRTVLASGHGEEALRVCLALWRFWWVRGRTEEASHYLESSLALAQNAPPTSRAEAIQCLGNVAWRNDQSEQALGLYRQALSLQETAGDRLGAARSLGSIGNACRGLARPGEAQIAYEQSLDMFRVLDDRPGIATSLLNLGTLAEDSADLGWARRRYEEALDIYRGLGDRHSICLTLANLANICLQQGCAHSSRPYLSDGLEIARELSDQPRMGLLLALSVRLALVEGIPERAAKLLGATEEFHRRLGFPLRGGFLRELERTTELVRVSLAEDVFLAARDEGRALAPERALTEALSLPK